MDEQLEKIRTSLLDFKKWAKENNFGIDDIETEILKTLDDVGFTGFFR